MSRFTLSPRAAVVLAAVVVAVALVVIVLGSRGAGAGGPVSVTGAADAPSAVPGAADATSAPAGPLVTAGPGSPPPSESSVVVHVLGAVARPGLVTVPGDSRVADAIDAAGGASGDADLARVNLARPVVDGERLYVPRVGESEIPATVDGGGAGGGGAGASAGGGTGAGGGGSASQGVVDLNAADQATLETLPGIGPALAQRILAWREEHGRFGSVQDLLQVSGIGDARFAELEPRVRV